MKIALMHFRVGETDGVSLEMDKWKIALEKMGHDVVYIAGSKGLTDNTTFIIEEIHYKNIRNELIVRNAYEKLIDFKESELKNEIFEFAEKDMLEEIKNHIEKTRVKDIKIWKSKNLPENLVSKRIKTLSNQACF